MTEFKLFDEIKVTKIKTDESREVIICNFEFENREGKFTYRLFGREDDIGIDNCEYEEEERDIYFLIHEWVEKHIETRRSIKLDGEDV